MSIVQSSFVSHLEGAIDGSHLEPNVVQTLHEGRPIWVRYDLQAIGPVSYTHLTLPTIYSV